MHKFNKCLLYLKTLLEIYTELVTEHNKLIIYIATDTSNQFNLQISNLVKLSEVYTKLDKSFRVIKNITSLSYLESVKKETFDKGLELEHVYLQPDLLLSVIRKSIKKMEDINKSITHLKRGMPVITQEEQLTLPETT